MARVMVTALALLDCVTLIFGDLLTSAVEWVDTSLEGALAGLWRGWNTHFKEHMFPTLGAYFIHR